MRRDHAGQSALLVAVNGNHVAIAEALIDAGASINVQAANRDTPWLLAGAQGRAEIIAKMIPRGLTFQFAIASAGTHSFQPVSAACRGDPVATYDAH